MRQGFLESPPTGRRRLRAAGGTQADPRRLRVGRGYSSREKIVALSGKTQEAELLLAEALAMRQARLPAGGPAIAEAEAALAQVRSPRRR
jgi:hypothetical protein